MMKSKLQKRVNTRKREIQADRETLMRFIEKTSEFVNDIKSRSVIYGMIKSLPLWKALEALIEDIDG